MDLHKKMFLLSLFTVSSFAELISELSLVDLNITLSAFTRVNSNLIFKETGLICLDNGKCENFTDVILVSNSTGLDAIAKTLNYSQTIDSIAVVFRKNSTFNWEIVYPRHKRYRELPRSAVFSMERTQWEILYNANELQANKPVTAEFNYYYDCMF